MSKKKDASLPPPTATHCNTHRDSSLLYPHNTTATHKCNTTATQLQHNCNTAATHHVEVERLPSPNSQKVGFLDDVSRASPMQHTATQLQHSCNTTATQLQHNCNTPCRSKEILPSAQPKGRFPRRCLAPHLSSCAPSGPPRFSREQH